MAETFTNEERKLLNRLKNVSSSDSVLIKKVEKDIEDSNAKISKLEAQKAVIEENIRDLKSVSEETKNSNDYLSGVLEDVDIEKASKSLDVISKSSEYKGLVDLRTILEATKTVVPKEIERINSETNNKEAELETILSNINDEKISLDQATEELKATISTQQELKRILEEKIGGDEQIPPGAVKDVLRAVKFSEDEIIIVAGIMLVNIKKYNEFIKGFEVEKDPLKNAAKDMLNESAIPKEEPKETKKVEEKEVSLDSLFNQDSTDNITKEVDEKISLLKNNGIEYEALTDAQKDILAALGVSTISNNIETINRLNMKVTNNVVNVLDSEFAQKVDLLESKGYDKVDIYLNIKTVEELTLSEMIAGIEQLEASGIEVKIVPISTLSNFKSVISNKKIFDAFDIPVTPKSAVILDMPPEVIDANAYILKQQYNVVNIVPPKDVTPSKILSQLPKDIVTKADKFIEFGEQDILTKGISLLCGNAEDVISRIELMKQFDMPYKDDSKYKDIILSNAKFMEKTGVATPVYNGPTVEETIGTLKEILADDDKCVAFLDKYYDDEMYGINNDIICPLIKEFENLPGVNVVGLAYDLDGVLISKPKFERNLKFLYGNHVDAQDAKLYLAAAVYGSLKTEEEVERIASILGFNHSWGGR